MSLLCPKCHDSVDSPDLASKNHVVCANCGTDLRLHRPAITQAPAGDKQRLGRFELHDTIGIGAFGTVYKAWDTDRERTVALNVPRLGVITEPKRNQCRRD